jgi:bacillithiol biosynthesis cysteine-adding enzyme BshC
MDCTSTSLSYAATGYFSTIVTDYLSQAKHLQPFYTHPVNLEGVRASIENRKKFSTDRKLLVNELRSQYAGVDTSPHVRDNIEKLLNENTFTVCTAHQPALFTGTLYFIYKILHAIRLSETLKNEFRGYDFVPVFYMGCEDADIDELGHIFLSNEKIEWNTNQKGAVGRMKTKGLDKLLSRIEGELGVQPHGAELMNILRSAYTPDTDIQTATFKLVNALFAKYGLIVLIPDNGNLKRAMLPVFEDDLLNHTPSRIVESTITELSEHYKVQANPRDINLFYLHNDIRERIEKNGNDWKVLNHDIQFDETSLKAVLHGDPRRFSPNVILRGLFQETILPNIAFIGGGGELAYWLELKNLFEHYKVPYPVLVVRNSFLFIEQKWKNKIDKLGFNVQEIFSPEDELMKMLVQRESDQKLSLDEEIHRASAYYNHLKAVAERVDDTLVQHVAAIQTRAIKPIQELEKKLIRAEKRKFEAEKRHVHALKSALFPNGSLQERIENFMPFSARWGEDFMDTIYKHSLSLEQQFVVLTEE